MGFFDRFRKKKEKPAQEMAERKPVPEEMPAVKITAEEIITEEKTSEEFVEFIPASGEKLPQTGTLWWPVPILAVSGVVFILVGIIFRKREN